jgi:hypothetical protein
MAILIGSGRVSHRFTVAAGATEIVTSSNGEILTAITIGLAPGALGTGLCEYRLDPADGWKEWPESTVSAETVQRLSGEVQALRFTATTADMAVTLAVGRGR